MYFTDQKAINFFTVFMVQNRGYFHNTMRLRLESVHVHVG